MSELPAGLAEVVREAAPLTERFAARGHRVFLVGGIVRDSLLGRTRIENDLDATTDARPEVIKSLVAELADVVWTQGERFGTIGCRIGGQIYEITTHRAESYDADSRKPTVAFGDRIEDDLARRDFTVNAMAVDLESGELIDPHDGRGDLAARILRTPLDPKVAFSDDPLRMLRAARFHSGYALAPVAPLRSALEEMGDRIAIVSTERIRDELEKLLLLAQPGPGLQLLAETGLLGRAVPRLADLGGPAAVRLGARVAAVEPDAAMRWGALLADVDVELGDLRALRLPGALIRDVVWLTTAGRSVRDGALLTDSRSLRTAAALAPAERTLDELLGWLAAIEVLEGGEVEAIRERLAVLAAAEPDLADPAALLTGQQVCAVLGVAPGPEVGRAVRWLRDLRFAEGPLSAEIASARLTEWWPNRDS